MVFPKVCHWPSMFAIGGKIGSHGTSVGDVIMILVTGSTNTSCVEFVFLSLMCAGISKVQLVMGEYEAGMGSHLVIYTT